MGDDCHAMPTNMDPKHIVMWSVILGGVVVGTLVRFWHEIAVGLTNAARLLVGRADTTTTTTTTTTPTSVEALASPVTRRRRREQDSPSRGKVHAQ